MGAATVILTAPERPGINQNMNTLASQRPGFTGLIIQLKGAEIITARLRELGFIPGESIELIGAAPFGEPFVVRVHATVVAIRKEEARCIEVAL